MIDNGLNVGVGGADSESTRDLSQNSLVSLPQVGDVFDGLSINLGNVSSDDSSLGHHHSGTPKTVLLEDAEHKPFHRESPKQDAPYTPFERRVRHDDAQYQAQPDHGQSAEPPGPAVVHCQRAHNYFEDFEGYGSFHPNHGDVYRAGDWIAGEGNEIEILAEHTYLRNRDANKVLEIEAPHGGTSVYRDFATTPGERFALKLEYSPRKGHSAGNDSAVDVFWEGQKVATLVSNQPGMQTYQFTVTANNANGVSRLEFRARDDDSYGGIVDNISLQSMGFSQQAPGTLEAPSQEQLSSLEDHWGLIESTIYLLEAIIALLTQMIGDEEKEAASAEPEDSRFTDATEQADHHASAQGTPATPH